MYIKRPDISIVEDKRTVDEKINSLKKFGVNISILTEDTENTGENIILGLPNIKKIIL